MLLARAKILAKFNYVERGFKYNKRAATGNSHVQFYDVSSWTKTIPIAECRSFAVDVTPVGGAKTAHTRKQTKSVRIACRFAEAIV